MSNGVGSTDDPRTMAEISTDDLHKRITRLRERLQEVAAGKTKISAGQIGEIMVRYEAELRRRRHD